MKAWRALKALKVNTDAMSIPTMTISWRRLSLMEETSVTPGQWEKRKNILKLLIKHGKLKYFAHSAKKFHKYTSSFHTIIARAELKIKY